MPLFCNSMLQVRKEERKMGSYKNKLPRRISIQLRISSGGKVETVENLSSNQKVERPPIVCNRYLSRRNLKSW